MRIERIALGLLIGLSLIALVASLEWRGQGVAAAEPIAQLQGRTNTAPPPAMAAYPPPTMASYPPPPTAVPGAHTPGPYSWVIEVVDRGEDFIGSKGAKKGRYPSLALDPDGRPHISYHDEYNGSLVYAHYDGDAWRFETVERASPDWYGSAIALDQDLRPHILYCPYHTNGYVFACWGMKHAYWNGAAFQISTIKTQWGEGVGLSLALDRSDRPYASYVDLNNGKLEIVSREGNAWSTQPVDGAGYGGTSLALDSANFPHIAYPAPPESVHLNYAHSDGTVWLTATVDSAAGTGTSSSLALDRAGRPHISYFDPNSAVLKYAWYDGAAWQIEVVDTDTVGSYTSLVLDANDRPHIAYARLYDRGSPCNGLKYAYRSGNSWQVEVVDDGNGVGCGLSLGVDAAGHPHIAYYGNFSLKYAVRTVSPSLPESGGTVLGVWVLVALGGLIVAGLALRLWTRRRTAS